MTEFTGEVHPVADLFPMLADDELHDLAASIKASGLDEPLTLNNEGRLLDGRNRLAACRIADVKPRFEIYEGDDPADYALRTNITRRHLTTGARAIIAEQARRLNGNTKSGASKDLDGIHANRLIEAGLVLDWEPALAPSVIAGATPLSKAVERARDTKRDAEALDAKMARLQIEASDLKQLVGEGRMTVDDAIAVLDARQTKAEQEILDAERRRADEQRDARELLDRVLMLAAPTNADGTWADAWADRLGHVSDALVNRTEQAGRLLLDVAERLRQ